MVLFSLFSIGDQVFGQPTNSSALALLDAVTNYDVYGSMGAQGYAGQSVVDAYYAAQAKWQALANAAVDPVLRASDSKLKASSRSGGDFGATLAEALACERVDTPPGE